MQQIGHGVFACFVPGVGVPLKYRVRFTFHGGDTWETEDPYRFPPTLGDIDLHLFGEGTHRRLWDKLGAHPCEQDGRAGVFFRVWAPNAQAVQVVGPFNWWTGDDLRLIPGSGVWGRFLEGLEEDRRDGVPIPRAVLGRLLFALSDRYRKEREVGAGGMTSVVENRLKGRRGK